MDARRLVSLGIVALLHIAVIAALLTLTHEKIVAPRAAPVGELIWFLPPPPKRTVVTSKPENTTRPTGISVQRNSLPSGNGITLPSAPPSPSLQALHGTLFGCADLDHLSPEERAHCGSALAVSPDAVDIRDGVNRSRQAALWERGRQRKNGPLLLPCMSPNGPPNFLAIAACLAKGAVAGGIDPNQQPVYGDTATVTHLPNNGDPPDSPSMPTH